MKLMKQYETPRIKTITLKQSCRLLTHSVKPYQNADSWTVGDENEN